MNRMRTSGTVVEKKQSAVRKDTFYISVETKDFGFVKFVSKNKKIEVGDKVNLITQKLRAMTDMIRWEEE